MNAPNVKARGVFAAFLVACAVAACAGANESPGDPARIGTAESRGVLFDSIIAMTERREAFSPVKERNLGFSALADMRAQRAQFVDASTETDLYYAFVRLSNARRDHHLTVSPESLGLKRPDVPNVSAPILVLPDYSNPAVPSFFVAAVDSAAAGVAAPTPGDRIVGVNGRSVAEYVQAFTPWVVHSTMAGLYWDMARDMPRRLPNVAPHMYEASLRLDLERRSGGRYTATLPYVATATLKIPPAEANPYPGFTRILERESFNVLVPDDGRALVVLQWLDFEYALIQDVVDLMAVARRDRLLKRSLVIDVTNSSGGARGAYAIQRLVSTPFRTTFGNVRISDAAERYIAEWSEEADQHDAPDIFGLNESGSWLHDWARTDATQAMKRGTGYTAPVPFKLAHLPRNSNGMMQPAPVHFTGPIAIVSGPRGGSHLDQFVSMFADNKLAYVVGMPPGGYSNTWEAGEVLTLPGTQQPLVRFMWNIGHTLRPNGEILEGNPVVPDHPIPLTRGNFQHYHQILLDSALAGLARRK